MRSAVLKVRLLSTEKHKIGLYKRIDRHACPVELSVGTDISILFDLYMKGANRFLPDGPVVEVYSAIYGIHHGNHLKPGDYHKRCF